jgi:hypothetical protein
LVTGGVKDFVLELLDVYVNGKHLPLKKRVTFRLLAHVSSVIGLLECLKPVISILRKPKTFEAIKK